MRKSAGQSRCCKASIQEAVIAVGAQNTDDPGTAFCSTQTGCESCSFLYLRKGMIQDTASELSSPAEKRPCRSACCQHASGQNPLWNTISCPKRVRWTPSQPGPCACCRCWPYVHFCSGTARVRVKTRRWELRLLMLRSCKELALLSALVSLTSKQGSNTWPARVSLALQGSLRSLGEKGWRNATY